VTLDHAQLSPVAVLIDATEALVERHRDASCTSRRSVVQVRRAGMKRLIDDLSGSHDVLREKPAGFFAIARREGLHDSAVLLDRFVPALP
jgi:hypothetical protein